MQNRKLKPELRLINMENVAVEQVEWLLYPFIPYGKVTIIPRRSRGGENNNGVTDYSKTDNR